MNKYNFVIYGATLEGLLTAYSFHQKGLKTLILEPSDKAGGIALHNIFNLASFNEENQKLLEWVKSHFNFAFDIAQNDLPPTTLEKGNFEPFVGFGENAPKESDLIQDYTFAKRLSIEPSAEEWIKTILSSGIEIRYNSNLTGLAISDGKISEITINDKDIIKVENFIFAQNPADLVEFLDPKQVSQKVISRLSKGELWSALQLSVTHEAPVTERQEIHVLYGTQKNPIVSIGRFSENTSQWISFISPDVADINEEGVQILKEMKRQIKRAYPEALENTRFERIALWPQGHGYIDLKSKVFGQLEGIENTWLCSNHLVQNTNPFLGSLAAAQMTIRVTECLMPANSSMNLRDNASHATPL